MASHLLRLAGIGAVSSRWECHIRFVFLILSRVNYAVYAPIWGRTIPEVAWREKNFQEEAFRIHNPHAPQLDYAEVHESALEDFRINIMKMFLNAGIAAQKEGKIADWSKAAGYVTAILENRLLGDGPLTARCVLLDTKFEKQLIMGMQAVASAMNSRQKEV